MATRSRPSARLTRNTARWIILLKGLTPIPYKIVTITSGFAGYNLGLFILFSLITRGARFFIAAFLLNRYGDRGARHHREAARDVDRARRDRHRCWLYRRRARILKQGADEAAFRVRVLRLPTCE